MEPVRTSDIAEIVRQIVFALDEIERDLQALGRTPVHVKNAKEALRDIEFRLMSETLEPEYVS